MIRRVFPSALLATGLAVVLALALQVTSHAQPQPCDQTYTVRNNDTLTRIARLLDVSEAEIRAANSATVPATGQLYVGQVLCAPPGTVSLYVDGGASIPNADSFAVGWSSPRLAIEVTYQFTATTADKEDQWNLLTSRGGGFVGRRLTMPLQAFNPIKAITRTEQLQAAVAGEPAPTLLAVRNSENSVAYTLVFIGDQAPPIASLAITNSIPIRLKPNEAGAPVEAVLGGPRIANVDLRIWLESAGNMRWPMQISHISFVQDAAKAYENFGENMVALAMVPTARPNTTVSAGAGRYQALVLLQHNSFGPAGAVMAANCEQWQGKRGVLYGLLRSLSRCPS